LRDISDLESLAGSLRDLEFEACPALDSLDEIGSLHNLQFFGFSDCGDVESLAPIAALRQLEELHAWGSTRVLDGDLSPLANLPRLRDVRMRSRRNYRPSVPGVMAALSREGTV
jgi:internalin A